MNIDWNKAPESATHFDVETYFFCNSEGYFYGESDFTCWRLPDVMSKTPSRFIPRPAKPAAPEWDGYVDAGDDTQEWGGKGWPPAGCECEFCDYSENEANRWKRCLFLGLHDGDAVWLYLIGANEYHTETNVDPKQFRPIPTKAQRDRDDVFSAIDEEVKGYNISIHCSAAIAKTVDAILSKYNLEPKS